MEIMSRIYTAVVIEYFKQPVVSDDDVQTLLDKYDELNLAITSYHQLLCKPRGSFIGKFIDTPDMPDVCVFYPFFSHIKTPIKPGEQVFVIWNGKIGYWLSRKSSDLVAEDANYTHNDRSIYGVSSKSSDMTKPTALNPAKRFPDMLNAGISYSLICDNSDSIEAEFQGEPVPRYSPISTDLSLQGSNNSLIVLGSSSTLGTKAASSGMIDLVAGRGQTSNTSANQIYTNDRSYQEIDKTSYGNLQEGILDLASDLSRVHVTMNMNPDTAFSLKIGEDLGSGPTIVQKSNKIRINARNDVKISTETDAGNVGIVLNGTSIVSTSGTGLNATSVLIESQQGFQALLASSLTEISTLLASFGLPTPNTLNLISLLRANNFSSKISKSD